MYDIPDTSVSLKIAGDIKVSVNDIIPDEIQNRLIYWRDKFKQGYFEIGDIANSLIGYALAKGFRVTQQQVFDAVGYFCGKSGRTVRYYAETAAYFPQEIRQDFDVSPFSHFVFARSIGNLWEEVLRYSQENPSASEAKLRREFLGESRGDNFENGLDRSGALPVAATIEADEPTGDGNDRENIASTPSAEQKNYRYGLLSRVSGLREIVAYIRDNMYVGDLDEKTRNEVDQSLRVIDSATDMLLKAVKML